MMYRFILMIFIAGMLWLPASSILSQGDVPPGTTNEGRRLTIHVVQRGENLFRIALSYGLTTEEVASANGIDDPGSIQVGQRLVIPIGGIEEAPPEPVEHVVKPGESLSSIANLYNVTPEALATFNEITNLDRIYVGQILKINQATSRVVTTARMPVFGSAPRTASVTHIVQQGETLFRIATGYGTTVNVLQTANDIEDPTLIYAGQELIIPDAEPPQLALDLPEIVSGIDLKPLFFAEGRSGRVLLNTRSAARIRGTFLGRDLIVISDVDNVVHVTLIAVPVYTEPGVYGMDLTITPLNGEPMIQLPVNILVLAGGYESQDITLPDDRLNLLSPAVEENEINILKGVTSAFNPERYFNGPMSLPAAAVMNSPFGTRRSYNSGPFDRYHNGADFAGAPGSPILAAAPGRVVLADVLHIRGVSVVIDHGWGVYTNYSHMSERYVQLGDFVSTGQVIGTVGNTGRATGAHLHWELWLNGVAVDPMQWVREEFP